MTLSPGRTLATYEILGTLGAGGMGAVYRARDTRLEREVAIKVLPAIFSSDPERYARFQQEAKALAALNHPGIVTIHSIEDEGELHFLVMEVVSGVTLDRKIGSDGMELDQLLSLAIQLADALEAAHQAGITHRDLKPANVMVDERGRLKVLDFGLAKKRDTTSVTGLDADNGLTAEGRIIGTVAYMSPEQIEGKFVGPASDVFSLGLLLHEMASGQKAFGGDTPVAVLAATINGTATALDTLKPELPAELGRIVSKCLEKDPRRRYQSCAELEIDLERLRHPTTEMSMPRVEPAGPSRRRLVVVTALIVAGLASVVGLAREQFFGSPRSQAIRSLAVLPFEDNSPATDDSNRGALAGGMAEALITELGQIGVERVISRRSVMRYADSRLSLPEIARELKVDAVIEGSVQRADGQIHVVARLIEGATDKQVWSAQYTRDERAVLALQREIATEIADEIKLTISDERRRQMPTESIDPEAHRHYLLGQNQMLDRTRDGLEEAVQSFERALEIQPGYADAYAALASCFLLESIYSWVPSEDGLSRSKLAAERALELDPSSSQACTALGFSSGLADYDWGAAVALFERALDCNPNDAAAHHWYAWILAIIDEHAESVAELRKAASLNPYSPPIRIDLANHLLAAGEEEEGFEEAKLNLELFPENQRVVADYGTYLVARGETEAGLRELERALAMGPSALVLTRLGVAYVRAGQAEKARAMLARLVADHADAPTVTAALESALGLDEEASVRLRLAFAEKDSMLPLIEVIPLAPELLALPAYRELRVKMNLPAL